MDSLKMYNHKKQNSFGAASETLRQVNMTDLALALNQTTMANGGHQRSTSVTNLITPL